MEIASDSTRRRDCVFKRTAYVDAGIPDYWTIDGEDRTIRVARPGRDDVLVKDGVWWHPAGPTEPLEVQLRDVFGPTLA